MKIRSLSVVVFATILTLAAIPAALAQQERSAAVAAQSEDTSQHIRVVRQRVLKARESEPCTEDCEDPGSKIALPDDGGTRAYECASGNCSCAGAKDCVDMKKICMPDTIGCNDYGCTCAENPDAGGDDGG